MAALLFFSKICQKCILFGQNFPIGKTSASVFINACNMPNVPQSEVMGLGHAQRQGEPPATPGLPELPPGIVRPGPHATE